MIADTNKEVGVVLPKDFIAEVDAYAERNGLSRSAVLRMRLLNPQWNDGEALPVSA